MKWRRGLSLKKLQKELAAALSPDRMINLEQRRWVDVDAHDGSPFRSSITSADWDSEEWGPMRHEYWEISDAHGAVLGRNDCGVTRWATLGIYHLEIAGESYITDRGAELIELGRPIHLVPEPENEYDAQAIRIDIDREKIGYVPRKKTKSLRRVMRSGPVNAALYSIHRDRHGFPMSINGLVWRDGTILEVPGAPHSEWIE